MMIETDILYAYIKAKDWLKPIAEKLIDMIERGVFGKVYVSREVLHELYYVSMNEGISLNEFIYRASSITSIKKSHIPRYKLYYRFTCIYINESVWFEVTIRCI